MTEYGLQVQGLETLNHNSRYVNNIFIDKIKQIVEAFKAALTINVTVYFDKNDLLI